MEAQLKKGVLEMCVLFAISDRRMYGYDVMKKLKQYFPEVNESTFYAILRRLHKEKHAEVAVGLESNGPVRKYYQISENGREYLEKCIQDWKKVKNAVEQLGID